MSWMCELLFVEVDNETLFASARSNGLNPEGAVSDGKITIFAHGYNYVCAKTMVNQKG